MPDLDPIPTTDAARSARRKVAWRILPLLFFLYVIAYLDRANVGFAKLQMQDDLEFSETVFGVGVGLFFVGYMFLEIPGACWSSTGARGSGSRASSSPGALCSMAMALVETPAQFYLVRFLLGLAEAGFFPGVIVYFTHWFPRKDRARAMSVMLFGVPLSLALGAASPRCCSNRTGSTSRAGSGCSWSRARRPCCSGSRCRSCSPTARDDAKWLTPAEREWLEGDAGGGAARGRRGRHRVARAGARRCGTCGCSRSRIFATNIGGYVFVFWLPTVVEGLLATDRPRRRRDERAGLDRLVYLCGLAACWLSGWSSDRTGERKWHCIAGQLGAGLFLALSIGAGAAVGGGVRVAVPGRVLRDLLVHPVLGAADADPHLVGRGGGGRGHQHVREHRRRDRLAGRRRDEGRRAAATGAAMAFLAVCFAVGAVFVALVRGAGRSVRSRSE